MTTFDVAILVGSLRRESFSRKVARALTSLAPAALRCAEVEIGDLPLYNEDLDGGDPPPTWTRFRSRLGQVQAVLFVTPEYNRSVPGCLKNAIDVGSRPEGKSVFGGLAAGVVSVTPTSSERSVRTMRFGNRWSSSTCRYYSSRRFTSAVRPSCSTDRGPFETRRPRPSSLRS
jgi:NAD(P)H-dependent FMN reductase